MYSVRSICVSLEKVKIQQNLVFCFEINILKYFGGVEGDRFCIHKLEVRTTRLTHQSSNYSGVGKL
jgi:hypothetical protein